MGPLLDLTGMPSFYLCVCIVSLGVVQRDDQQDSIVFYAIERMNNIRGKITGKDYV